MARQRQAAIAAVRLDQQRLMQVHPAALKLESRAGEIEAKHPAADLVGLAFEFSLGGFETLQPMFECQRVMLTQTLDIADFKTGRFRRP